MRLFTFKIKRLIYPGVKNQSSETLGIGLAGKPGEELGPLTETRAKAAVPFGGQYRIIDFTLSNALHSGLRKLLVLTQYKSHSLHKHLRDGWSIFNPELGEYITTVPPQMRTDEFWYQGTADALLQNLYLIERSGCDYVIILPGDHIYRMDYAPVLEFHKEKQADLTVITTTELNNNSGHTIQMDEDNRVSAFSISGSKETSQSMTEKFSTGAYIFSTAYLISLINNHIAKETPWLEDIIQTVTSTDKVYAYEFGGSMGRVSQDRYWRVLHSLDDYYAASMDLLKYEQPLNLYQPDWLIRSYVGQHPPARTAPGDYGNEGIFINSIIGSGSVITGSSVQNSILFNNVVVKDEAVVHSSIIFDDVIIGKNCQIENCIIEKDVVIPNKAVIGVDLKHDRKSFEITNKGLRLIPKGFNNF